MLSIEDEDPFDNAVALGFADVFGTEADARTFREMMRSGLPNGPTAPRAQADLLALYELSSRIADQVSDRACRYWLTEPLSALREVEYR